MTERARTRHTLRSVLLGLLLLFIACYSLFEFRQVLASPQITIISPRTTKIANATTTRILGETKNVSSITLNERTIYVDRNGNFSEEIVLASGYNILSFEARDRFGKKITKKVELIRE